MKNEMRKFKVVRIYVVTALNKEDAIYLVHVEGGNWLEYESAKPYEEPTGFVKTMVKQVRGK